MWLHLLTKKDDSVASDYMSNMVEEYDLRSAEMPDVSLSEGVAIQQESRFHEGDRNSPAPYGCVHVGGCVWALSCRCIMFCRLHVFFLVFIVFVVWFEGVPFNVVRNVPCVESAGCLPP